MAPHLTRQLHYYENLNFHSEWISNLNVIVAGIMVILSLSLLTPYFYFIPKATLSSVIICAVIFMVEIGMVKPMWKSNSEYHFARLISAYHVPVSHSQWQVDSG
jgi:MFS superfamily sulfate permease-like transporter